MDPNSGSLCRGAGGVLQCKPDCSPDESTGFSKIDFRAVDCEWCDPAGPAVVGLKDPGTVGSSLQEV